MKLPKFIGFSALYGGSFVFAATMVLIQIGYDLFKIVLYGIPAFIGYMLFHSSGAWYLNALGFLLMLGWLPVCSHAFSLLWTLLMVILSPFIMSYYFVSDLITKSKFKKDVRELYSIAHDFLSNAAVSEYPDIVRSIKRREIDNFCFAILLWVWIYHLAETKKDHVTFLEVAAKMHRRSADIYDSLKCEMEYETAQQSLSYLCGFSSLTKRQEYVEKLNFAVNWVIDKFDVDAQLRVRLSNAIGNQLADFITANKL